MKEKRWEKNTIIPSAPSPPGRRGSGVGREPSKQRGKKKKKNTGGEGATERSQRYRNWAKAKYGEIAVARWHDHGGPQEQRKKKIVRHRLLEAGGAYWQCQELFQARAAAAPDNAMRATRLGDVRQAHMIIQASWRFFVYFGLISAYMVWST